MKRFFLSLLILVFIYSCTKTITPHLNTVSSQLIIQGAISDTAGPYYVSIVTSVDFYASNNYPGVSGASVIITNATTGVRDSAFVQVTEGIKAGDTIVISGLLSIRPGAKIQLSKISNNSKKERTN